MRLKEDTKNYLLVFILLFFSGNPFENILRDFLGGNYTTIFAFVLTLIILNFKLYKAPDFFILLTKILVTLLLIFLFQLITLGFVSWFGAFNFMLKIVTGGLIIYALNDQFFFYFFKLLYWLCGISLILYVLINILKVPFPNVVTSPENYSYFIYSTSEYHILKNQGMFWEPGAFAGIITLCLALNFNNLHYYWQEHRLKLMVVVLALLSTQSTTGYLVTFIIAASYILNKKNKGLAFVLLPLLSFGGLYLYESIPFLKTKVELQYQQLYELDSDEFSNSRFGSMLFDWYYIKKNPFTGNGMHESTRYADHPILIYLIEQGENLGHGNGFSNFLASMGIIFVVGYFILVYKALFKEGKFYAFLVLIIIFLNLQGEQWFNFLIYLGIPFISFNSQPAEEEIELELEE